VGQFPGDHSWDGIHGRALKPIPRELGVVAFLPDGKRLATASNPFPGRGRGAAERSGVIRLWNIASKSEIQSFESAEGLLLPLKFRAGHRKSPSACWTTLVERLSRWSSSIPPAEHVYKLVRLTSRGDRRERLQAQAWRALRAHVAF